MVSPSGEVHGSLDDPDGVGTLDDPDGVGTLGDPDGVGTLGDPDGVGTLGDPDGVGTLDDPGEFFAESSALSLFDFRGGFGPGEKNFFLVCSGTFDFCLQSDPSPSLHDLK